MSALMEVNQKEYNMDPKISYKTLSQSNKDALNEAIMDMGITSYDDLMQAVEVSKTFICEASMILTFEQFQSTRQAVTMDHFWCEDQCLTTASAEVLQYHQGCYIVIEAPGAFRLSIGPAEWRSNDLESLERLLYDKWYA